jgi:hypothetical protein
MDRWFRCIGEHAEDLTGGRLLAPGDFVLLDEEALADEHNARLIYEGKLIPADDYEPESEVKRQLGMEEQHIAESSSDGKDGGQVG